MTSERGDLGELLDRVLAPEPRYTYPELAERAGVPLEVLRTARASFGLPRVDEDERYWDDHDVEVASGLKRALDSGISMERLLELNRVIGRAAFQIAASSREIFAELLLEFGGGAAEDDIVAAAEGFAAELLPLLSPTISYAYHAHLREMVRSDVISAADISAGKTPDARNVAVAFADLVGFTKLGEQVPAEEVGEVVRRLETLASELIRPPVTFVKTLGDAVMLVAPSVDALLDQSLQLVDESERRDLRLRVGIGYGPALERAGDWYGSPVNQASRLTAVARPASVLATQAARDNAGDGWEWSYARERKLKGLGEVKLHRVRRADAG